MVKLFVVGFPRDMETSELTEIFAEYGIVEKALIVTDAETGESKGYGFVDMQDMSGAQQAIANLDGGTIDDRVISVRIKEDKEPAKKIFSTRQSRPGKSPSKRPKQALGQGEKKKRPRL